VAGRQRQALDDRLEEDSFLPPEQERAMIELDESVEALDSAIEYKNDILLRVRERDASLSKVFNGVADTGFGASVTPGSGSGINFFRILKSKKQIFGD
jgi:hypothetical protein